MLSKGVYLNIQYIYIAIYMAKIYYFLCPSHYSKYFTHINSFYLYNSPMIIPILQ